MAKAPKPLTFGAPTNPGSIDLSLDLEMPPVGDQGNQGSCVAWAVGYGMCTYEVNKAGGGSASSESSQASPSDLYALTIQAMLNQGMQASCGEGTDPGTAVEVLLKLGVESKALIPYSDLGCVSPVPGTFMIKGYHWIDPKDSETIKTMLNQQHPVAIGVYVPMDFQSFLQGPNASSVYTAQAPLSSSGHAMLIVGFDDTRQAWRIMNSWGSQVGDNGFLWMSYAGFSRIGQVAYVADGGAQNVPPPAPGGAITFTSISAIQYLDFAHLIAYLVMPFTLSEPMFVSQWRMINENNGTMTPWQSVNQWTCSNYVWYGIFNQTYPMANYSLEFTGKNRLGAAVSVKGTAPMQMGKTTARASKQIVAPLLSLELKTSGTFSESSFGSGLPILMNGVLDKLQ